MPYFFGFFESSRGAFKHSFLPHVFITIPWKSTTIKKISWFLLDDDKPYYKKVLFVNQPTKNGGWTSRAYLWVPRLYKSNELRSVLELSVQFAKFIPILSSTRINSSGFLDRSGNARRSSPGCFQAVHLDPRHFVLGRSPSKRRPQLKKPGTFQSWTRWSAKNRGIAEIRQIIKKHHCHAQMLNVWYIYLHSFTPKTTQM